MSSSVIGFDLGHSSIKMTFDGNQGLHRALVPSLACSAVTIRNDAEAAKAAKETVTVRGRQWFVGETAAIHAGASIASGLSADWVASSEHAALLAHGKQLADEAKPKGNRLYVLGLPVDQFNPAQKGRLIDAATDALDTAAENIFVLPQPMGAYYAHLFDYTGLPKTTSDIARESWAMVDVGYYSTDIVLLRKGRWAEKASGGSAGVQLAADLVRRSLADRGIEIDLVEAQEVLKSGRLKVYGESVDASTETKAATDELAAIVWDTASQLLGSSARSFDGVLVAGGGAQLVMPIIQANWPHARMVEDTYADPTMRGPRFVVSDGYYRFGRGQALLRARKGGNG